MSQSPDIALLDVAVHIDCQLLSVNSAGVKLVTDQLPGSRRIAYIFLIRTFDTVSRLNSNILINSFSYTVIGFVLVIVSQIYQTVFENYFLMP